ncbi:MAG: DUF2125 domain-containing protein, partial [Hyphomicrobiales bacterium]|nr:DUF2125 domain-containing protein [Hyphomicrobiales bacterium]
MSEPRIGTSTPDAARARRYRVSPRIAFRLALIALIVTWTAGWQFAASKLDAALDQAIAAEAVQGIVVTCPDRRHAGYPFALRIVCVKPSLTVAGAGGGVARAAALSAGASILAPWRLGVEATAPVEWTPADSHLPAVRL